MEENTYCVLLDFLMFKFFLKFQFNVTINSVLIHHIARWLLYFSQYFYQVDKVCSVKHSKQYVLLINELFY